MPYIVYERAASDLRSLLREAGEGDMAWRLRMLQQVATGLNQLHREGIAHLDVTLGNILIFDDGTTKLGDLGMACHRSMELPEYLSTTDAMSSASAAQRMIAMLGSPEWLYQSPPLDWRTGCQARDLYQFGGLIRLLFGRNRGWLTPALLGKIDLSYHPEFSDYRSALPFIRQAFDQVVGELGDAVPSRSTHHDLVNIFRELCDPDPTSRGDPQKGIDLSERHSLSEYVDRLGVLARRAESLSGS